MEEGYNVRRNFNIGEHAWRAGIKTNDRPQNQGRYDQIRILLPYKIVLS